MCILIIVMIFFLQIYSMHLVELQKSVDEIFKQINREKM